MSTLLDLAASLQQIAGTVNQQASDAATQAADKILADLVAVTPVDTSQALSNWQVTLDNPAASPIKAYHAGKGGSSQAESADDTLTAGRAVLAQKKPGQPIYITNVLPYIQRLNDGYSLQAPAGFVERAVLIGQLIVKNIRLIV